MNQQFEVEVHGITKREFFESGVQLIVRLAAPVLIAVTAVTVLIVYITGDTSVKSLISPFAVVLLCAVGYLFVLNSNYKSLSGDLVFTYSFDKKGWKLTVGEQEGEVLWEDTVSLIERKNVFLLHNATNSSSTLPKRSLDETQKKSIRNWFKDSRPAYKEKRWNKRKDIK